jgi:ferritin
LQAVAPMALRLRRSKFMADYFNDQQAEEQELQTLIQGWNTKRTRKKASK